MLKTLRKLGMCMPFLYMIKEICEITIYNIPYGEDDMISP